MNRKKILVVDDDAGVLEYVHQMLDRSGYESIPFTNASAALAMLASETSLDLAIVDLVMPEMNGLEFHAELKRLRPGLPCILATGYGSVENYLDAMNSGVFDYLHKPFRRGDLITAIKAALEKSETMGGGD